MESQEHQEPGLTMADYLNDMIAEENEAQNILKKNETKQCTYNKGYLTQTVFGCHTCGAKGGMCLACYLNCHLDHDTFEIGLKRNFRCDCGTHKFEEQPCTMRDGEIDAEENANNVYDHNFRGKFCRCKEDYNQDLFMIRCLHCLDYFHLYHLGLSEEIQKAVEGNEDHTQMICQECVNKHYKFLKQYENEGIYFTDKELLGEIEEEKKEAKLEKQPSKEPVTLGKRTRSLEESCKFNINPNSAAEWKQTLFMKENWNNNLCFCDECQKIYKDNKVFDILAEDVVNAESWEQPVEEEAQDSQETSNTGVIRDETLYNQAMGELTKLDFITQSRISSIYSNFIGDFKEFFEQYKDGTTLITQKHIEEFFEHLKEKKGEAQLENFDERHTQNAF